jgi:hypothetical protein
MNLPVLSPPQRGSIIDIRVDHNGRAIADPWDSDSPVPAVLETALGGLLSTVVAMLGMLAVLRQWLFRRRTALWQSEWERVAPLWCGRG